MWSKLSHALKPRSDSDATSSAQSEVLTRVYEQHPNLSVFHDTNDAPEVPFPTPSPPASPSKHGRRSVFKRMSKVAIKGDDGDSSLRLPMTLPKRVKSSLNINTNVSQTSLRPSSDTARPPTDDASLYGNDKYGSVRSILRDPNTPGTGQNVRFFSRDAYKVISPDVSVASDAEHAPPPSFLEKLQQSPVPRARPSVAGIFAAEGESHVAPASMLLPVGPPELTNPFDMSQEHALPPIPRLESAAEVVEPHAFTSTPMKPAAAAADETVFHSADKSQSQHDRSQSFSFGQTVFHSLANRSSASSGSGSSGSVSVKSRGRALSDTMFQNMIRASSSSGGSNEVNDDSSHDLVVYASPEPDPFSANATTYYTPQTLIPPTPPQDARQHQRTASKVEDIIWSLRTQLAVQQEMCAQFEVDLSARDELVQMLHTKLDAAERDGKERRGAARAWRKKVAELERVCRHLEEEVDRSREDSVERSIMDEASGEAMRELHRRISGFERERADWERREAAMKEQNKLLEEKLKEKDDSARALQAGIADAQEEIEKLGHLSFVAGEGDEELRQALVDREREGEEERERHRVAEFGWEEERAAILTGAQQLQAEKDALTAQLEARDDEYRILQAELEAQWQHTETASERIEALEKECREVQAERDALKGEVEAMDERIREMEMDWTDSENKKAELEGEIQEIWTSKEEIENERAELEGHLKAEQDHADGLANALQEREHRLSEIEQERQFALESVARLEANVQQLSAELAAATERAASLDSITEAHEERISTLTREHERAMSEKARALNDVAARESEARTQIQALVREKAEVDAQLETLKSRVSEMERLRQLVHDLQQESADKEVKIVQLTKSRAQDKEDLNGLNIALDSKQQELELMKRKSGVRGTAGSTPAQPSKVAHRRDSSMFSTPGYVRPPSAQSDSTKDASAKDRKTETPATATKALGRSGTGNATKPLRPSGSMGPPPAVKARPSMGTPTPLARGPSALSRSTSTAPAPSHRRASSATLIRNRQSIPPSPVPSEADEKENVATPTAKAVRRTSVPVPA